MNDPNAFQTEVRYKDADFDQLMNGLRREPRGSAGTVLLFTGMPRQTLIVEARSVAARLGRRLYVFDPRNAGGRYIGETEKNLVALFKEATRSGWILFFDEADVLFGKRTEVQDAHDRHANTETNTLRDAVLAYRGLTILATNDPPAALSRIRPSGVRTLVVKFPP